MIYFKNIRYIRQGEIWKLFLEVDIFGII